MFKSNVEVEAERALEEGRPHDRKNPLVGVSGPGKAIAAVQHSKLIGRPVGLVVSIVVAMVVTMVIVVGVGTIVIIFYVHEAAWSSEGDPNENGGDK